MARPILQLQATDEELLELGRMARGTKVSVGDRFRDRNHLLRLEGKAETKVARTLGCSVGAVCKWSKRFDAYGITGLKEAPGRGRKARLPAERISLIVERATRAPQGRTRCSVRSMAREARVSKSTVQRIWECNDIKPYSVPDLYDPVPKVSAPVIPVAALMTKPRPQFRGSRIHRLSHLQKEWSKSSPLE